MTENVIYLRENPMELVFVLGGTADTRFMPALDNRGRHLVPAGKELRVRMPSHISCSVRVLEHTVGTAFVGTLRQSVSDTCWLELPIMLLVPHSSWVTFEVVPQEPGTVQCTVVAE